MFSCGFESLVLDYLILARHVSNNATSGDDNLLHDIFPLKNCQFFVCCPICGRLFVLVMTNPDIVARRFLEDLTLVAAAAAGLRDPLGLSHRSIYPVLF